jgi:hypothetical protein
MVTTTFPTSSEVLKWTFTLDKRDEKPGYFLSPNEIYCSSSNPPYYELGACQAQDVSNDNAFVGYAQNYEISSLHQQVFSDENISKLSAIITESTKGLDPEKRNIVVPPGRIAQVLSSFFRDGTRTHLGDIYTRFIIPQDRARNDLENINMQTLNVIISTIRDEYETIENNKRLSIWTTVLGDFNSHGLRSYPVLKMRRRMPQRMMFNMNY